MNRLKFLPEKLVPKPGFVRPVPTEHSFELNGDTVTIEFLTDGDTNEIVGSAEHDHGSEHCIITMVLKPSSSYRKVKATLLHEITHILTFQEMGIWDQTTEFHAFSELCASTATRAYLVMSLQDELLNEIQNYCNWQSPHTEFVKDIHSLLK